MIAEMPTSTTGRRTPTRLQWGRDLMIAEIHIDARNADLGAWLQWGRDLMIAEIRLSDPKSILPAVLQWGRDLMIAEIRCDGPACGRIKQASMGPRSDDRGNRLTYVLWRPFRQASMGPRSDDRGNAAAAAATQFAVLLQWGRDLMIAEICAAAVAAADRLRRFNGAAI